LPPLHESISYQTRLSSIRGTHSAERSRITLVVPWNTSCPRRAFPAGVVE
jgi:hypothetical protein